ncbi:thermonuclease family protein [Actinoallomurus sp. CA-142502]|uniref:thermonuclease family protein n=1 Tax=Actinoallomurus sp. CA-142502 TaxID=3239885 RepID=UPI003D946B17
MMPLRLIKGSYRILHSQPDGDSIHFFPDDAEAFVKLRMNAHLSAVGSVQLRLDAIDALETHYTPHGHGGFTQHQPLPLAHAAADRLLALLGFSDVKRERETVTSATPDETPGYILTRFADKYGRPVAFAYAGASEETDLAQVRATAATVRESVNHRLLSEGLVYPTFYSKLYPDLRAELTTAAQAARAEGHGVWSGDATTSGATVTSLADLDDHIVILPKLFRRLVDYLALGAGDVSLDRFTAFLAARNDRLFVISEAHATGLDTVTAVSGQKIRLTHPPEDLVFIEA